MTLSTFTKIFHSSSIYLLSSGGAVKPSLNCLKNAVRVPRILQRLRFTLYPSRPPGPHRLTAILPFLKGPCKDGVCAKGT